MGGTGVHCLEKSLQAHQYIHICRMESNYMYDDRLETILQEEFSHAKGIAYSSIDDLCTPLLISYNMIQVCCIIASVYTRVKIRYTCTGNQFSLWQPRPARFLLWGWQGQPNCSTSSDFLICGAVQNYAQVTTSRTSVSFPQPACFFAIVRFYQ